MGRRLLRIVVYDRCCRISATLTVGELAETSEIGDWKMPDFKAACSYAASQGWLIVQDDMLTLTTAGLAAGLNQRRSNSRRAERSDALDRAWQARLLPGLGDGHVKFIRSPTESAISLDRTGIRTIWSGLSCHRSLMPVPHRAGSRCGE